MNYRIRMETLKESNEFLRCLWAIFERNFGKCAWQFIPRKIGKERKVFFGFMDIGLAYTFEVSIVYYKRGCIEELILNPSDSVLEASVIEKIDECIKQASNYQTINKSYYVTTAILKSYNRILPYKGQNFRIEPAADERCSSISFTVSAFSESQAFEELQRKLLILINLMSVETKTIYTYRLNEKKQDLKLNLSEEIYLNSIQDTSDEETLEHIIDNNIALNKISKEFKQFIDLFLDPNFLITENHDLYFKACAQYQTAKKMYENSVFKVPNQTSLHGENFEEIALTSYMSALEVITLKDYKANKCSECKQPIFSIKYRVKSIIQESYGDALSEVFGKYYDDRSKYLHSGITFIGSPRTAVSIPTLSLEHSSGCNVTFPLYLDTVDDVVRSILREQYVIFL